ncbi:putative phosphatase [Limnospira indica PCC 8005]|uniref:Phosphatase n=1 Tax=Limnospira indica PCC 8005 TaxID=376219 RepID=A0A9P1KH67_9CYAN|nr:putative phosphatase [Limnospira indica PCC 8005]
MNREKGGFEQLKTVLFWDIDGTLLNTKGAGRSAMEAAIADLIGDRTDLSALNMAGLTDWDICSRILEKCNLEPTAENIEQLEKLYIKHLPEMLLRCPGYVLGGVREILENLQQRTDVLSLVLTGNMEAGGRAKLAHYGLDSYFPLGAFSRRSRERVEIAQRAMILAEQQLGKLTPDRLYVIGDTPHDVRCGQAIGARAIAIASGHHGAEELRA